ncbi:YigZ family protein [Mycoplasmopsis opalescens]|uniref:YigZ family protein n=1 Tax=Mycoplasmopsis opalescens TaxID=114886 RepID=UPI0004A6F782|nr:YigZ family protein [Mycoplasmopsis opalescens]
MEFQYYEIKKSRFYSIAYKIVDRKQINEFKTKTLEMLNIKKSPNHICYGYYFRENGIIVGGFDDDGEPKGTAGKPIRDLIIKSNTEGIIIFVIRYFGGKMLGAGGLGRAYNNSASLALKGYKQLELV